MKKIGPIDPDLLGALPALRRAAAAARMLSIETGTPFYVWKDGRVADLNEGLTPAARRAVWRRAQARRARLPVNATTPSGGRASSPLG